MTDNSMPMTPGYYWATRKQFFASQDVKRCKTTFVGAAGECLACGADQGVACRASLYETAAAQSAPVKGGE